MRVLVIIPAYNEASIIGRVVSAVVRAGYEVLVIDDGSEDTTARLAIQAGAKVLQHLINLGQGAALQTGFLYAQKNNYQFVVTFDADGQHEVEDIAKIIEPLLLSRYEIALGSRFLNPANKVPPLKKVILKLAVYFTRLTTGLKVTDVHNGLRAISVTVLPQLVLTQNGMAHASEIISLIKRWHLRWLEIPVVVNYSAYAQAKGQPLSNSFKILWDLFWQKIK